MKLLVLDGPAYPGGDPNYRGTFRAVPSYCTQVPPDHELNRLFIWYIEEGGERGVVSDCVKACRFAELWNEQLGVPKFEVIEVTDGVIPPESKNRFIGFDLSAGYGYSLIGAGGLREASSDDVSSEVKDLCELMSVHFKKLLNVHGLLQTYEDAYLCLRAMKALQRIQPNLFEGGNLSEFRVVGVHVVCPEKERNEVSAR